MDIKLYRERLANAEARTWILGLLALGLVLALIANGLFRRTVILHVAPAQVTQPYELTATTASPAYLRQMALSVVALVADVTPASVTVSHEAFRRYVTPERFGVISEALAADAAYVKQYHLSRVFFPETIQIEGTRVTLLGTEHRYIGHNKVAEEGRGYQVQLRIRDWQVQVEDLVVGDDTHFKAAPGGAAPAAGAAGAPAAAGG